MADCQIGIRLLSGRISDCATQRADRKITSLRQKQKFLRLWYLDTSGAIGPDTGNCTKQGGLAAPGWSAKQDSLPQTEFRRQRIRQYSSTWQRQYHIVKQDGADIVALHGNSHFLVKRFFDCGIESGKPVDAGFPFGE